MNYQKTQLRKKHVALRNAIPKKEKRTLDQKIIERLITLLDNVNIVAIYYPKAPEINLLPLRELCPDKTWLFPRTAGKELGFFRPESDADFIFDRRHKIYEPTEYSKIIVPEAIVCPMIAFDISCNRVGYGGGYYDNSIEFIKEFFSVTAIGVAYSSQQEKSIPVSGNDQEMDMIVTEKEIIINKNYKNYSKTAV